MKSLKELQSTDPSVIYCIGDNRTVLKFEVGSMNWMRIPLETDSRSNEGFDGTLRYSSSCFIPPCPDERIIVTGGCYSTNNFPANHVTEFTIKTIKHPRKKKPMLLKRYGHCSVYLNSLLYAIGGFAHKDLPNEPPVTLNACERMTVNAEKTWNHISSMCEPRAFMSCVCFNSQYIYVFGGMQDYNILESVEKYDSISDTWSIMYFSLPKPLAKLGICLLTDDTILIVGGMSKDFEPSNETYLLTFSTMQWIKKQSLSAPRLTSSGLFCTEDFYDNKFVYAIGGNKT